MLNNIHIYVLIIWSHCCYKQKMSVNNVWLLREKIIVEGKIKVFDLLEIVNLWYKFIYVCPWMFFVKKSLIIMIFYRVKVIRIYKWLIVQLEVLRVWYRIFSYELIDSNSASSWSDKPFFANLHPYDMYQSSKQQEQMFPHKNYDRFGKKDAKLRIGWDKHAIILWFHTKLEFNVRRKLHE